MDVHDGPLQSLGVTALAVDRVLRRLDRGEDQAAREEIVSIRKMISDTVSEIRAVLKDLSLDVLRTYGLSVAIQNYADWFAGTTDIRVEVRNSLNRRLTPDIELVLYRLMQEALANIRKHSEAKQVRILLSTATTRDGEELELVISDNGKGFDIAAAEARHESGHGLGLKSMKERIEATGGAMLLYTERGEGTVLTFRCQARHASPAIGLAPLDA
jgi:signal transduction histidine kinase